MTGTSTHPAPAELREALEIILPALAECDAELCEAKERMDVLEAEVEWREERVQKLKLAICAIEGYERVVANPPAIIRVPA